MVRRIFLLVGFAALFASGCTDANRIPKPGKTSPADRGNQTAAKVVPPTARVEFGYVQPGQQMAINWGRYQIAVVRRSTEDITALEATPTTMLASPGRSTWPKALNAAFDLERDLPNLLLLDQAELEGAPLRSYRKDILVVLAVGPEKGCTLRFLPRNAQGAPKPDWNGGFLDPCTGGMYDLAGRKLKASPGQSWNLFIPPHQFVSETELIIGLGEPARALPTGKYTSLIDYESIPPEYRLTEAAMRGRLDLVEKMVGKGLSLESGRVTPLMGAVSKGYVDVAEYLLEKGAQPNATGSGDVTPLFFAIHSQDANTVRLLLRYGADPNAVVPVNTCGGTPLMIAVCMAARDATGGAAFVRIIETLRAGGAEPIRSYRGKNAIGLAAHLGRTDLIPLLTAPTPAQ